MALSAEDKVEIWELYYQYNFTVDILGDAEKMTEFFVEDCSYDHYRFPELVVGKAAIRDFMQQAIDAQAGGFKHLNDNIILSDTPDGPEDATGVAYIVTIDGRDLAAPRVDRSSMYRDVLRRTEDGWKFVQRKVIGDVVKEFRS
ncbi:nuclear transport factor 2 family protein [Mumia sp. DW29H23]|uniref:nuclear transport factor 2 family protein n=1 Tax=Mumia sp. DW29H23 TaxID=3421241 RepID=UPI003D690B7F